MWHFEFHSEIGWNIHKIHSATMITVARRWSRRLWANEHEEQTAVETELNNRTRRVWWPGFVLNAWVWPHSNDRRRETWNSKSNLGDSEIVRLADESGDSNYDWYIRIVNELWIGNHNRSNEHHVWLCPTSVHSLKSLRCYRVDEAVCRRS